jgi:hypothetical protein
MEENQRIPQSQKISVLLAEYNTLRTEVIAARGNVAQAISLASAVIMAALGYKFSKDGFDWFQFAQVAASALAYLGFTFWWNEKNTRTFTARLREIEGDINERASERIILWETDYGWGSIVVNINKNFKGYTYKPKRHF